MSRIIGFEPILHQGDRILILGSMPSVESLKQEMYYANKTNRFWPMLGTIYQLPYSTKEEKLELLELAHISVWDVCHSCIRETSADAKIKEIIPNDIEQILQEYPSIEVVLCNGKTSFNTLKKYFPQIEAISLPSTSAANAKLRLEDLISQYKPYLEGE
ncbi:MAG: DNA-deoxyinosine glycosylase [Bacillota bacterium]|nr:DNA-deoxyinosine glycosylase [Bacillota bacterium]